jgi:polyhydroxyalkanoate synthesis regulator phasin
MSSWASSPTAVEEQELQYVPRSPTPEDSPEEGELVEHPGVTYTTVISHDPHITEAITVATIDDPLPEAVHVAPLPVRLHTRAQTGLPSPPIDIPRTISPQSAANIIQHPDVTLDQAKRVVAAIAHNCIGKADTLQRMAQSSIDQAAAFEEAIEAATIAQRRAEQRLEDLQRRVEELQGPECPEGFIENCGRVPHFHIPLAPGQPEVQARYVRRCPGDPASVEGTMGAPGDPIYVIGLTAQSRYNVDGEPEPLAEWFTSLAEAGSRCWPQVLRAAIDTDDWGLAADLARYHAFEERLHDLDHTIRGLENTRQGVLDKHRAAAARLACARADQRLGTLRALVDEEGVYRPPTDHRVGPTRTRGRNGRGRPF